MAARTNLEYRLIRLELGYSFEELNEMSDEKYDFVLAKAEELFDKAERTEVHIKLILLNTLGDRKLIDELSDEDFRKELKYAWLVVNDGPDYYDEYPDYYYNY